MSSLQLSHSAKPSGGSLWINQTEQVWDIVAPAAQQNNTCDVITELQTAQLRRNYNNRWISSGLLQY